ncbi:hypothetical protein [Citrobacter sedlakii]|uniref:hypothetical protein n=1 Tax=Citrobacter sedlakii TaxID=67826 RepID=UPI002B2391D6|nr:hypothetical protein [Citrobacter sedlakii]MEB0951618.1 hypothetical protein [Citrobacter sedlakii]
MEFLKEHHLLSIIFGTASAIFWIVSCAASSKKYPEKTEQGYSMLGHIKTSEIQSKWNARAALCAALAALAQVFGY